MISMFRGDSHTISITVTTTVAGVETAFDLTGASAVLSVKARASDSSYLVQKAGAVVSPGTLGVVEFELEPADTASKKPGTYVYDVQITTSDSKVYTVAKAAFEIKEDVTV